MDYLTTVTVSLPGEDRIWSVPSQWEDGIFGAVSTVLGFFEHTLTRADRRVLRAFNAIDGCTDETLVQIETMIKRGIYLELSGFSLEAQVREVTED